MVTSSLFAVAEIVVATSGPVGPVGSSSVIYNNGVMLGPTTNFNFMGSDLMVEIVDSTASIMLMPNMASGNLSATVGYNGHIIGYISGGVEKSWVDKDGNFYSSGSILARKVSVPSLSGSPGSLGDFAADTTYLYICVASNDWRRVSMSSW